MTRKRNRHRPKGAEGVPCAHAIYAPALRPGKHGLYRDVTKVDGRTRIALLRKNLRGILLEQFSSPPAIAQVIADRCTVKLLRIAGYESSFLAGNLPEPRADQLYLQICESVRRDLASLWAMARDSGSEKRIPDLEEYLKLLRRADKAQVIEIKGEKTNDDD